MTIAKVKRVGIIGWPVSHSLSPRLHNYWFKRYGISGEYEALGIAPADFDRAIQELNQNNFIGVNITVPYKERVLSLLDEIEPLAKRVGAVNTLVLRDGKRMGRNTDIYGFTENLKTNAVALKDNKALILGAGGAARAACAGILSEGGSVIIANRTYEKAVALAQKFGGKITTIKWNDCAGALEDISLLVNTTTLGMVGQPALELDLNALSRNAIVMEVVYNPLQTPLLKLAQERGNKTVDGLGMLLYQAKQAFEAWFGVEPEVTEALRRHVLSALL